MNRFDIDVPEMQQVELAGISLDVSERLARMIKAINAYVAAVHHIGAVTPEAVNDAVVQALCRKGSLEACLNELIGVLGAKQ
jgi:hypothetical protein